MIKRIVHCSDIHIRTTQLHDLYRKQFNLFLEELRVKLSGFDINEIRIVITGDIFHYKITISNEQILLASWFLSQLAEIGKVVIIPGNHDFLENNTERIDSITPLIELLKDTDITYFKDSGEYRDDNIKWVVYSLYQHNVRPKFTKEKEYFNVGLFHGPIQGMSTDLGYSFDDAYDRLNFNDLDLLLCGDIHKRQTFKLPNGSYAIMIGSLLQQDFGENIKSHGYGIYDVPDNQYDFYDLPNDQPFLHFKINDIKDIETEGERLVNAG